jgi:hypothetical protein
MIWLCSQSSQSHSLTHPSLCALPCVAAVGGASQFTLCMMIVIVYIYDIYDTCFALLCTILLHYVYNSIFMQECTIRLFCSISLTTLARAICWTCQRQPSPRRSLRFAPHWCERTTASLFQVLNLPVPSLSWQTIGTGSGQAREMNDTLPYHTMLCDAVLCSAGGTPRNGGTCAQSDDLRRPASWRRPLQKDNSAQLRRR